jgi:glycosyltransferase involved in cell wall biosynthesis
MNVAILSVTEGEGHGAETVLEQLLRGWGTQAPALTVLATAGSRVTRVCRETGTACVEFAAHDTTLGNVFGAIRAAHRLRCDLVHGWTARSFEVAWLLAGIKGVPFTCTLHDHPQGVMHRRHRHALMRFVANRAATLVTVSHAVSAACSQSGYVCPISVVPNGLVDFAQPAVQSAVTRIGFLGMYSSWKGFPVVRRWIGDLGCDNVKWRLYGAVAQSLAAQAAEVAKRFPELVTLPGNRPIQSILAETDIIICPSTEFDPFPTVLIEAAMQGLPAVASNCGGVAEILEHGVTGFLFDLDDDISGLDHLRALCRDSSLRRRMGEAARRRFEKCFTVAAMAEGYRRVWESAAKAGPE